MDIEPSSCPAKLAGTSQRMGVAPGNALLLQVARANNTLLLRERQSSFLVGLLLFHEIQCVGKKFISTNVLYHAKGSICKLDCKAEDDS